MLRFIFFGGIICAALSFCRPVLAQFHDQIGLTALRAATTNINGSGIRVAQPEGDVALNPPAFEVNPANVGQPAALFSYASAAGTAGFYPNTAGTNSWHAEDVGNYFYGTIYGVATNVAHVDNSDADYFYTNYISNLALPALGDSLVNQSFIFCNDDYSHFPISQEQDLDSQYDNYAAQNGTLFISSAGDGGPTNQARIYPSATCYNGIGVAAYFPSGAYSCIGPTLDNGRCKPDITALSTYTSISTPLVSGAAAMLLQAGARGDGGGDTNSVMDMRTIKALLLNGAVKPLGWTNGNSTPLDARYGSGMLNILNSYEQLAGGRQSNFVFTTVSTGGAHPPVPSTNTMAVLSGWDFGTNTSSTVSDAIKHYFFNVTNNSGGGKFIATATLVWNRHKNKTTINNLNLFLYDCATSNLVACSTSLVDNVEHIYKPDLAPGRYDLQVWKAGGSTVTTNEIYALAFEFIAPSLNLVPAGTNVALTWPLYPAGFLVETATNLVSPAWTTNNLPAAGITNGRNYILLNATDANQFFRLRRPNF